MTAGTGNMQQPYQQNLGSPSSTPALAVTQLYQALTEQSIQDPTLTIPPGSGLTPVIADVPTQVIADNDVPTPVIADDDVPTPVIADNDVPTPVIADDNVPILAASCSSSETVNNFIRQLNVCLDGYNKTLTHDVISQIIQNFRLTDTEAMMFLAFVKRQWKTIPSSEW